MNVNIGDKALITTDCWFLAPDGHQYKAVWGTVKAVRSSEETLGIKTNARSTNWYVEIGNMTIAGCQIHYMIKAASCKTGQCVTHHKEEDGAVKQYMLPSNIYNADEVRYY